MATSRVAFSDDNKVLFTSSKRIAHRTTEPCINVSVSITYETVTLYLQFVRLANFSAAGSSLNLVSF